MSASSRIFSSLSEFSISDSINSSDSILFTLSEYFLNALSSPRTISLNFPAPRGLLIQLVANAAGRFAKKEFFKNKPHHLGLFLIDDPFLIRLSVRISVDGSWISERNAFLKLLLNTSCDVLGNRVAFFLRQSGKNRQKQFAGNIQRIDILILQLLAKILVDAHILRMQTAQRDLRSTVLWIYWPCTLQESCCDSG